jgi:hypothetical protein
LTDEAIYWHWPFSVTADMYFRPVS